MNKLQRIKPRQSVMAKSMYDDEDVSPPSPDADYSKPSYEDLKKALYLDGRIDTADGPHSQNLNQKAGKDR